MWASLVPYGNAHDSWITVVETDIWRSWWNVESLQLTYHGAVQIGCWRRRCGYNALMMVQILWQMASTRTILRNVVINLHKSERDLQPIQLIDRFNAGRYRLSTREYQQMVGQQWISQWWWRYAAGKVIWTQTLRFCKYVISLFWTVVKNEGHFRRGTAFFLEEEYMGIYMGQLLTCWLVCRRDPHPRRRNHGLNLWGIL